jgi:hypothetical protein
MPVYAGPNEAAYAAAAALERGVGPFPRLNIGAATPAVANRFVVSTNMKVGAYALANTTMPTAGTRRITVTHTAVTGTDTLGTIDVVGTDRTGAVISESIVPIANSVATSTKWFQTVTSVTGAGWVINTGNDTLVVGCAAGAGVFDADCTLHSVVVNTTAAGTITLSDSAGTIAVLKASVGEGTYVYGAACSGFLSANVAAASDITVLYAT